MDTFLYWFIQLTWGFTIQDNLEPYSAFVLICRGHKPQTFGHAIYFEIGNNWGGVNFGGFFFVQRRKHAIKHHEYGHGFQNMMLGIFMPFFVNIPSAIRYRYRNYEKHKGIPYNPTIVFGVRDGRQN